MSLPDNRMRFPSARIDFSADVGTTGQDHDSYPPPQGQARYDHMRMAIIALLANQSSYSEPTQKREGTLWFDLNIFALKFWFNGAWRLLSEAIPLAVDGSGDALTLAEWYETASAAVDSMSPDVVFSGAVTADGVTTIPIPASLQSAIAADARCFLYVNGSLVDPRLCSVVGSPPTTITLTTVTMNQSDVFTVVLRRVPDATFYGSTISVP